MDKRYNPHNCYDVHEVGATHSDASNPILRYGLYQCYWADRYYRSDDVRNVPTVQLISLTLRLNAKRRSAMSRDLQLIFVTLRLNTKRRSAMSRGRRDLQKRCCANPIILAKRWEPYQRRMERCRCYVTVDHYHLGDSFRNLQRCQWPVSTLYETMSRYWQSLHIRNDVTLRPVSMLLSVG
jgi:hypothetical protein